jgi:hypothetical protein
MQRTRRDIRSTARPNFFLEGADEGGQDLAHGGLVGEMKDHILKKVGHGGIEHRDELDHARGWEQGGIHFDAGEGPADLDEHICHLREEFPFVLGKL